jgi:hypothetical protein
VSRLAGASRLPLGERVGLAWEIVTTYALARRRLRRDGLRPALAALREGAAASASDEREAIEVGRRLGRAVGRTLGPLPADSRCLMTSLVLTRLLARRGIASDLVISVRPGETLAAHAWLERDGVPLLAPDVPEAGRLTTL